MEGWFTFEVGGGEFIFKSEGYPMGEALILMVGEVGGGLTKKIGGRGKPYLLISADISIFSSQICKFFYIKKHKYRLCFDA